MYVTSVAIFYHRCHCSHQDFFLDLIFAPIEKPTATPTAAALTVDTAENASGSNSADNSEAMAAPKDGDNVDASGGEGQCNDDIEGEQAEQQAVAKKEGEVAEGEGKEGVPPESENSAMARSEYRDDFGGRGG